MLGVSLRAKMGRNSSEYNNYYCRALSVLLFTMSALRTDTTREFFLKRKLINYTKNELQGINILKLRLPKWFKMLFEIFLLSEWVIM